MKVLLVDVCVTMGLGWESICERVYLLAGWIVGILAFNWKVHKAIFGSWGLAVWWLCVSTNYCISCANYYNEGGLLMGYTCFALTDICGLGLCVFLLSETKLWSPVTYRAFKDPLLVSCSDEIVQV